MNRPVIPNFKVNTTDLELVLSAASDTEIRELSLADASLLARHIEGHFESLWVAYSGVQLAGTHGVFDHNKQQVAIEWVRHETHPQSAEPNTNVYRSIFGWTKAGKAIGIDVTTKPNQGAVANHWEVFESVFNKHFPPKSGDASTNPQSPLWSGPFNRDFNFVGVQILGNPFAHRR